MFGVDVDFLTGVDRLMLILTLSACWSFICVGIQAPDNEDEVDFADLAMFWYGHIIVGISTIYTIYRTFTQWR